MSSFPTIIRKPQPAPIGPAVPDSSFQSIQTSIPTRRGDILRLTFYSSLAFTASVIVRTYVNGDIQNGQFFVNTNTTRAARVQDIDLTDGHLVGVYVTYFSGTAPLRGQCFVKGELRQGTGTPAVTQLIILSNYLTGSFAISYPTTPLISSVDGVGVRLIQTSATLGPTFNVPTNARWFVIGINYLITTSAVVANRIVSIQQSSGGNSFIFSEPRVLIPASTTYNIFAGDYSESTATFLDGTINRWWIKFPKGYLLASDNLGIGVGNAQAGDSAVTTFGYEELLDV